MKSSPAQGGSSAELQKPCFHCWFICSTNNSWICSKTKIKKYQACSEGKRVSMSHSLQIQISDTYAHDQNAQKWIRAPLSERTGKGPPYESKILLRIPESPRFLVYLFWSINFILAVGAFLTVWVTLHGWRYSQDVSSYHWVVERRVCFFFIVVIFISV